MPGEQSHECIALHRRDGIPLAPGVMASLDRVAQELDIPQRKEVIVSKAKKIALAAGVALVAVATIVQAACPFCQ